MLSRDKYIKSALHKGSSLKCRCILQPVSQTVAFWSSSQGKRDESTNVDAAKAKADAKVRSLPTELFIG